MIKHSFSACCKKNISKQFHLLRKRIGRDSEKGDNHLHGGADDGGHEEDLVEVDEVDHDGNATDKVDKDETFHPGGEKLSL